MNFTEQLPYWTQLRQELAQWFEERAPSFAEAYIAAVHLIHTPEFPARMNLICHIVRDIYSLLPAEMGEISIRRRRDILPDKVGKLSSIWKQNPPNVPSNLKEINFDVTVNSRIFKYLVELIEIDNELKYPPKIGHQLAIALYRSRDLREDNPISPWILGQFHREYKFFVERSHINSTKSDDNLVKHFEAFERAFHSLIGSYFTGKDDLDAILQKTNNPDD